MRLKRRELDRYLAETERAVAWLRAHAAGICDRANADSFEGIRSSQGGGRASGHSDPVAVQATARRIDPAGDAARELHAELLVVSTSMRRAERLGRGLLALPAKEASELALKGDIEAGTFSGSCVNCKALVARTANDRLRSGRCSACYQYRRDHYGNERPRELWAAEEDERRGVEVSSGQ